MQDCIRAFDGTHIRESIPKDIIECFHGRKPYLTQNVLPTIDFELVFTYVLGG